MFNEGMCAVASFWKVPLSHLYPCLSLKALLKYSLTPPPTTLPNGGALSKMLWAARVTTGGEPCWDGEVCWGTGLGHASCS